jgi:hypothetical protein
MSPLSRAPAPAAHRAGATDRDQHAEHSPDPLDMPLRALLGRLLAAQPADEPDPWLEVDASWRRRVTAAAERGECEVSRVGRRVLWRRSERDSWIERHAITPRTPEPEQPKGDAHIAKLVEALR